MCAGLRCAEVTTLMSSADAKNANAHDVLGGLAGLDSLCDTVVQKRPRVSADHTAPVAGVQLEIRGHAATGSDVQVGRSPRAHFRLEAQPDQLKWCLRFVVGMRPATHLVREISSAAVIERFASKNCLGQQVMYNFACKVGEPDIQAADPRC